MIKRYGCHCNALAGWFPYALSQEPVDYIDELCFQASKSLQCIFHDVANLYPTDDEAWLKVRHYDRNVTYYGNGGHAGFGLKYDFSKEMNDVGSFREQYPFAEQLQHYPGNWVLYVNPVSSWPWLYNKTEAEISGLPNMFYETDVPVAEQHDHYPYKYNFNATFEGYSNEEERQTTIRTVCYEAFGSEHENDPNLSPYKAEMCIVFEYFVSKIREFINNGGSMNNLNPDYMLWDRDGVDPDSWNQVQTTLVNRCTRPLKSKNEDEEYDGPTPRDMPWEDLEPKCVGQIPSRKTYGSNFANDFVDKAICGYKVYDPLLKVCCDPVSEELEHSLDNCLGSVDCDNCVHNCWEACGWGN